MRLTSIGLAMALAVYVFAPSFAADTKPPVAPVAEIKLPRQGINTFALSPDGRVFAVGTFDGKVEVYGAEDGSPVHALGGHEGDVATVTISADGALVASGGTDGILRISDIRTGDEALLIEAHEGAVGEVAFSADGTLIATGGWDWDGREDRSVKIWDTADGSLIATYDSGSEKGVSAVAFTPDGRRLLVGRQQEDGRIDVIDTKSGRLVKRMAGVHESGVGRLAFSPDGRFLATGSVQRIGIWDPSNWSAIDDWDIDDSAGVIGLSYTPDGHRLLVGSQNSWTMWSPMLPMQHLKSATVTSYLTGIGMTPDGKTILAATGDGRLLRWAIGGAAE